MFPALQLQEDDFATVTGIPSHALHSGPQGLEITDREPAMPLRQRYGVTGPAPFIPDFATLTRSSLGQLRRRAEALQGPSYGTQKAAALIRLYEAASRHRPVRSAESERFDPIGDPIWAMIDAWHQDAARYREYLRLSRRETHTVLPPEPQPQPPQQPPQQPPPGHQEDPRSFVAQNAGVSEPEMPQEPSPAGHAAAEGIDLVMGGVELVTESLAAGMIAAVASVAAALLNIAGGDEFNEQLGEAQHRVFNYCMAFAHTIRGEAPGSGEGAAEGTAGAREVLARAARQPNVDMNRIRQLSMISLYGIAWRKVAPRAITRLQQASTRTQNSRDMVRAAIVATATGGAAYGRFGGP
jgi:hypothetical protein